MGESFRNRLLAVVLAAVFLLSSCSVVEKEGSILVTAVRTDCLSRIQTIKRLNWDLKWEEINPSWSEIDCYNYWHFRHGGGVYIIDSFEQLSRVADRIETVSNYFSEDEHHSLCAEYKNALLKRFPKRYFRKNILVVLGGVPGSPKTFVSEVDIENDRLQVSLSTYSPGNWAAAFAAETPDWEQMILIPVKRPGQELDSASVTVEKMADEWDAEGPGPDCLTMRWVTQEELFPNPALFGE